MKRVKHLILLIFVFLASASYAQQDAQFSQYMFNGMYYNPGYTGVEKLLRTTFISRVQWLGYQPTNSGGGAPQSNIISASTPVKDWKMGIGGFLLYETLGPIRNIQFNLSVAKHFIINNGTLGIGLNGGVYSQKLNNNYVVVDPSDDIYQYLINPNSKVSQVKPDLNVGIWYEHQKYYAGVSLNHIPRADFTYGNSKISSRLADHLYVTAGYRIQLTYNILVTPSFLVQSDLNQLTYLFGGLVEYNKKIWAGLNARQSFARRDVSKGGKTLSNDDIILYIGINLLKNKHNEDALRVGYAFDFVTSGVIAKKRTSHEIMVSYMIPNPWGGTKPPVRTPRYRHEN
jgi:type IX secretion system PorP/SprF family membrane protein